MTLDIGTPSFMPATAPAMYPDVYTFAVSPRAEHPAAKSRNAMATATAMPLMSDTFLPVTVTDDYFSLEFPPSFSRQTSEELMNQILVTIPPSSSSNTSTEQEMMDISISHTAPAQAEFIPHGGHPMYPAPDAAFRTNDDIFAQNHNNNNLSSPYATLLHSTRVIHAGLNLSRHEFEQVQPSFGAENTCIQGSAYVATAPSNVCGYVSPHDVAAAALMFGTETCPRRSQDAKEGAFQEPGIKSRMSDQEHEQCMAIGQKKTTRVNGVPYGEIVGTHTFETRTRKAYTSSSNASLLSAKAARSKRKMVTDDEFMDSDDDEYIPGKSHENAAGKKRAKKIRKIVTDGPQTSPSLASDTSSTRSEKSKARLTVNTPKVAMKPSENMVPSKPTVAPQFKMAAFCPRDDNEIQYGEQQRQKRRGAHVKDRPEMQEAARRGQEHWARQVQELRKTWSKLKCQKANPGGF
jgi:hypothetical protein